MVRLATIDSEGLVFSLFGGRTTSLKGRALLYLPRSFRGGRFFFVSGTTLPPGGGFFPTGGKVFAAGVFMCWPPIGRCGGFSPQKGLGFFNAGYSQVSHIGRGFPGALKGFFGAQGLSNGSPPARGISSPSGFPAKLGHIDW